MMTICQYTLTDPIFICRTIPVHHQIHREVLGETSQTGVYVYVCVCECQREHSLNQSSTKVEESVVAAVD